MISDRVKDFFGFFDISLERQQALELLAQEAAYQAEGMTHLNDYLALAAILEIAKPKMIFEIGTYKGVTSNFFLKVLPDCKVISIAYLNPKSRFFSKRFNNSELKIEEVGSMIDSQNKDRFIQVLGDSHSLIGQEMVKKFGPMDLIFIDGDHSKKGVAQDTRLAIEMTHQKSTICWHDANPKEKYYPVRDYLENELEKPAIATADDYIGGIACWNIQIEEKLKKLKYA